MKQRRCNSLTASGGSIVCQGRLWRRSLMRRAVPVLTHALWSHGTGPTVLQRAHPPSAGKWLAHAAPRGAAAHKHTHTHTHTQGAHGCMAPVSAPSSPHLASSSRLRSPGRAGKQPTSGKDAGSSEPLLLISVRRDLLPDKLAARR